MYFKLLAIGLVSVEQLFLDIRLACGRQQGGQPLLVGDDAVEHLAGLELARPAHKGRHPVGALPVGVLFAAPGGDRRIRPGVEVRAIVGRVLDNGVLGYAKFIQHVEHAADGTIVQDHAVVVKTLAADALRLFRDVRSEMHVSGVPPHKEGHPLGVSLFDKLDGVLGDLVVNGFHALLGQRAGVLDAAVGVGMDHAARAETLSESRVLRVIR